MITNRNPSEVRDAARLPVTHPHKSPQTASVFDKGYAMGQRSIATQWRGIYSYDKTPNLPSSCVDTDFNMQLRLGCFGRFTGSIIDSAQGIPEPATIRGRLSGSQISFSKMYVSLWVDDLSGELKAIPGEKSYVIYYAGKFVEQRNRVVGNWGIRAGC